MAFDNILVVCVGNICRSPIAEALLTKQYPNKSIDSAGVAAVVGHGADEQALKVMQEDNIDMSSHIAKQINEHLVTQADLILTMSDSQTKCIENQWPHSRGKTFKLGHWSNKDIADPYKLDDQAFITAKQDIVSSLKQWTDKVS
jgi:protein-tyrosine phosphatase